MIIDATERFSQRNTTSWFQKLSGQKKHLTGNVISLQTQSQSNFGDDVACDREILTASDIVHLQNSTSLLVTHNHEISLCFYRKVVKAMWWKHDRFRDLLMSEESRLLSALLDVAETPSETLPIAFLLADNWVKYRYMGDLGETYDTITYLLNETIEDVLEDYFTPEVKAAWRKVLAPNNIFDRSLSACKSK